MLKSPLYGDWDQVWRVFEYHSGHYFLGRGEVLSPTASGTYRPITMLTLLVSHALVPEPWLHHLVSWLMHVATSAVLYVVLLRQDAWVTGSRGREVALLLSGLFLLHPVMVETYVWINGRSDLLAGLCLAVLALLLSWRPESDAKRYALIACVAFLGAGSKSTFLVASVALWIGSRDRFGESARPWPIGLLIVAGFVPVLVGRLLFVPFKGQMGASEGILTDWSAWSRTPRLVAMGSDALLGFRAEAMQSLAWAFEQPPSVGEWIGGLVTLASIAFLAWRRDRGGLAFLFGGMLTLAPCVVVSKSIWMGFDRYLYMPAILFTLAGAPYATRIATRLLRWPVLGRVVAAALVLVAVMGTWVASASYANQFAYQRAMLSERPADSTVRFLVAKIANDTGDVAAARQLIREIPSPPWPQALIMPALALAGELSDAETMNVAIEYGLVRYPEDADLRAYGMRLRYMQGRFEEALDLASSIGPNDAPCEQVRLQLRIWTLDTTHPDTRHRVGEVAKRMQCAGDL
ncbi:MAG: tetratricopeptide repeat protein [Polyangiales bacterium]